MCVYMYMYAGIYEICDDCTCKWQAQFTHAHSTNARLVEGQQHHFDG